MFKTEIKMITALFILAILHLSFYLLEKVELSTVDLLGFTFVFFASLYVYYIYFTGIRKFNQ